LENKKTLSKKTRIIISASALLVGAGFIVLGIFQSEVLIVLNKAIKICMECIGLG